jgi:hypothetical protein
LLEEAAPLRVHCCGQIPRTPRVRLCLTLFNVSFSGSQVSSQRHLVFALDNEKPNRFNLGNKWWMEISRETFASFRQHFLDRKTGTNNKILRIDHLPACEDGTISIRDAGSDHPNLLLYRVMKAPGRLPVLWALVSHFWFFIHGGMRAAQKH